MGKVENRKSEFCYKLVLAYDGTTFSGWQIQPGTKTIQEEVQNALSILLKKSIFITGSGRTDAGVHALAQVAHFKFDDTIDLYLMIKSLNGMLYPYIQVITLEKVEANFHARYDAKKKTYRYSIWSAPYICPLKRWTTHHIRHQLDIPLLREAAKKFIGTHDFTSFANIGSPIKCGIRTIYNLDVLTDGPQINIFFTGNGFLYKMVRNITGLLLEVGSHKIALDEIEQIFKAKDRKESALAAPAKGLTLISVSYPK